DVILFLFSTAALPPPDGLGSSAAAVARVRGADMFAGDPAGSSVGPFSAPFAFSQVQPGSYQIRAFLDAARDFEPFFDFARQPRAGDPVGSFGDLPAAKFGVELRLDAGGQPAISDGDGFFDVYPQVLLQQIADAAGAAVAPAEAVVIPCKANALPLLPALVANPAGGPL